ncbi:MAG: PAS domain S-box protein [Oryzomonas sp.]|uniref:hybrid sensor histidine kinase/response regulator n=1 Tax=Oryzomonas sp. TaxID=2855186 RepID=UPI00284EB14E|nr:PAS domain S-box protein [Oryzomonas sp.]MDR3580272.1 PAS domain S-box protein [Oryzomonas sp.]
MSNIRIKPFFKRYGIVMSSLWTFIICLLAALTVNTHHANTIKDAESEARDYFRLNMFYRTWAAKMGGVYVPVEKVAPNPYLTVLNRDITTNGNRQLTLVNPAYMTRMVFESILSSSPDPIINKITSLKPLNPINAPDKWEKQCLEAFERKEYKEHSEVTNISGKPYLRLISMFVTDGTCLKCHAHQGYHIGDIRGAITISVPLAKRILLQKNTDKNLIGGYLILWLLGSIGITVTSRRRSLDEESLQASEQKLRMVCDWTQDWEYWIAPDGTMKYVSPSCFDMTGYSPDEFIAEPELLARIIRTNHKSAFDEHQESSVLQSSTTSDSLEFQIVTKGGDIRWIQHLCRPIFDGAVYLGRRASNRDITVQKIAEEKISRLSAIVEHSDDAIISKTLDGIVTSWNRGAEKLFGHTEQEMVGKTLLALFPDDRLNEELDILNTIARGESVEHFETVRVRKDGRKLDVSVTISPIRDQNGTVNGVSKVVRDITDRKRAANERLEFERQLMQTQKLESLGVLAGGIAHDFNNILMSIIGNADLALTRINKESPATENLCRVLEASTRAADLARQMLAYSGKGKFIVETIDMNLMVEEMTHMLEVSISKKAVLRLNLHQPLPSVKADTTQLRQVIMNLVINASEAIGDKSGIIAISTGCINCDQQYLQNVQLKEDLSEGLYVYLEIADTGCGMDKETLTKLFDPFFTTKFTGRGLGMAAVQGIVRGHKGAIKVYSELGKGTTFKVLLPASTLPQELFNGNAHPDPNWHGSGTVLLVDDEETVLGIGSEMLRELGFDVITATDGQLGVDLFRENRDKIDFVILDLTMPHMDGEQCFRELRQLKPVVKVIMSSGFSEYEVTQKFMGKGLAGFIQKPYRLSALREAIQKI